MVSDGLVPSSTLKASTLLSVRQRRTVCFTARRRLPPSRDAAYRGRPPRVQPWLQSRVSTTRLKRSALSDAYAPAVSLSITSFQSGLLSKSG